MIHTGSGTSDGDAGFNLRRRQQAAGFLSAAVPARFGSFSHPADGFIASVPTARVIICVKLVSRVSMASFVSECKTGRRANKKKKKETPRSFLPGSNEAFFIPDKTAPTACFVFLLHMVAEVLVCLQVEISFSKSNPAVVTEHQQLFDTLWSLKKTEWGFFFFSSSGVKTQTSSRSFDLPLRPPRWESARVRPPLLFAALSAEWSVAAPD